jgi:hypothetical protein
MPVTYSPPYDSPIEDAFARHFSEYASESINLATQVHVTTICGLFILDFLITTSNGHRIGIECDGKEFHNESRDEWRDGMILGEAHVDTIYRLRGADINHRIEDVLLVLCNLEPGLFNSRARAKLRTLASDEALQMSANTEQDVYSALIASESEMGTLRIEARRRIIPLGQRRFWMTAYKFAVAHNGGNLDDLMATYRANKAI